MLQYEEFEDSKDVIRRTDYTMAKGEQITRWPKENR
jgi:hypothetical protein